MRRITILVASVLINAAAISGLAAEPMSDRDVDPALPVSAALHGKPAKTADSEKTCRAHAASFHESVMRRQAAAGRIDGARMSTALDFVMNAFNDLLATKCGS